MIVGRYMYQLCFIITGSRLFSCYVVLQNNTFPFFFFVKKKIPSGWLHYSEASETLSASRYSQFSSLLLACFGKYFGKQSSVLFNANEFFDKVVHVDMKLEYNTGE